MWGGAGMGTQVCTGTRLLAPTRPASLSSGREVGRAARDTLHGPGGTATGISGPPRAGVATSQLLQRKKPSTMLSGHSELRGLECFLFCLVILAHDSQGLYNELLLLFC